MRKIFAVVGFVLANLVVALAYGQSVSVGAQPANPARPRVHALIAAVGEQFTLIQQKPNVGSHLPPFERVSVKVEGNKLNRAVLVALNDAIASTDPASKRIFMTLPAATMDGATISEREAFAIGQVVGFLEKMPERLDWDSIVVATPAYKAFQLNGIPGQLAGFGVYYQPLHGNRDFITGVHDFDEYLGEESVTPENKTVRNLRFTAPFSFIEIWVLDPKTLAVLDRQRRFDNRKLYDPFSDAVSIRHNISDAVLVKNISSLIMRSVAAAVLHTDILTRREIVIVHDPKLVPPEGAKK